MSSSVENYVPLEPNPGAEDSTKHGFVIFQTEQPLQRLLFKCQDQDHKPAFCGLDPGRALDLRSTGRGFKSYSGEKLDNNLGQVVHTYVPLSPSSITWYRPRGGDALRLGR